MIAYKLLESKVLDKLRENPEKSTSKTDKLFDIIKYIFSQVNDNPELSEKLKEKLSENGFSLDDIEKSAVSNYKSKLTSTQKNRNSYEIDLKEHINSLRKGEIKNITVMFIDLQAFKSVNDIKGYRIGDKVLVEVGNMIKNYIKSFGEYFHFGGDELVGLFTDKNPNTLRVVGDKLKRMVDTYAMKNDLVNLKDTRNPDAPKKDLGLYFGLATVDSSFTDKTDEQIRTYLLTKSSDDLNIAKEKSKPISKDDDAKTRLLKKSIQKDKENMRDLRNKSKNLTNNNKSKETQNNIVEPQTV